MSWPFVAAAREKLALDDPEVELIETGNIRSYDELHAVLKASPSLDLIDRGIRRRPLMERMSTILDSLSPEYRVFLDAAHPPPTAVGGADIPATDGLAPPQPVPNWPLPADAEPLGTKPQPWPNLTLPVAQRPLWPPRDQLGSGTCVGFAAAGAIERAWMLAAATAPDPLAAIYLYNRSRARLPPERLPPGAAGGASRLEGVRLSMPIDGACPRADWPDAMPVDQMPTQDVMAKAVRTDRLLYWDLSPTRVIRPAGVARVVFDLLHAGVPVALAAPLFQDPAAPAGQDNWNYDYACFSGKVADPAGSWARLDTGHAVAVLAFQADATQPDGGWFIFRNSRGRGWCTNANIPGIGPLVPERGWGAMSATYVERHVWEILAVMPGRPND